MVFVRPVSFEGVRIRLTRLLKSIQKNGYYRHDGYNGDIGGYILVKDGKFVVMIITGQHRIAVLAALDFQTIAVRIGHLSNLTVVRREEVHSWPGVQSSVFTIEEALQVFDRIFEGKQPLALTSVWPPASKNQQPGLVVNRNT